MSSHQVERVDAVNADAEFGEKFSHYNMKNLN